MYQEQQARGRLEHSTASLEDFLRSLDMEISIRTLDAPSFARAVDLIHKTNQFNLTSRRHSASVLRQFMEDDAHGVFSLRVSDRFGDNGIVGLAIVQLQETTAMIDTLLLSCRVIGRTVETAFLAYLTDWARARGVEDLDGEFIATPKNAPAADFYRRHGFSSLSGSDTHSHWRLRLVDGAVQWPPYIRAAQPVGQVV
jgi:FkbH-like protein